MRPLIIFGAFIFAIIIVVFLCLFRYGSNNQGRLSALPDYILMDGSLAAADGKASFRLLNTGNKSIEISKASSSCSCVQLDDVSNIKLRPGESIALNAVFKFPYHGIETHNIYIYHDQDELPLVLSVDLIGTQRPPYIMNQSINRLGFFDLQLPIPPKYITFTTCEPSDKPAWLGTMTCDVVEARIDGGLSQERIVGNLAFRDYKYTFEWQSQPSFSDFTGNLNIELAYGPFSKLNVGVVVGTTRDKDLYHPRAVRLDSAGDWSEVVTFRRLSSSERTWTTKSGWEPPSWLELKWGEADGQQTLLLKAKQVSGQVLVKKISIPICLGSQIASELQVVLENE